METQYAQEMLDALTRTANAREYAAHMALISKDVSVYGVPGFEVIGYDDWARQCRFEFDEGILKQVSYAGLRLVTVTSDHVLFKTTETVEGTDGTVNRHGLEILIRKEVDGKWRVLQERILSDEEMNFDSHKAH
ncbi:MAG: nuclear transport factor 2 family protein [Gammaproteobacteria bacterium]|nr:nuclear transport factor 2 family protein [Gammaproteobacteria bacterium]